uniref:Uncharacterized protein n=1 Tax=viral metagenome TaxID=1070528 RepID=A0A6C0IXM6_9ZZZZ
MPTKEYKEERVCACGGYETMMIANGRVTRNDARGLAKPNS